MARTGITYQDVKTAIDEIMAEGLNPTIAGLRERLGTGSFSTISEHLKHWRQEQHEKPTATARTPAPDALSGLMQNLWVQAKDEANKELAEYKAKIEQELRSALEEKNQALKAALDTEGKNRWLEDKNTQLQNECLNQQQEVGRLQAKVEQLDESRLEALNQLATNKSEHQEQLQRWQDKNATLQQSLAENALELKKLTEQFQQQLIEERTRAEKTDQRWLAQLDEARQKIKLFEQDALTVQKKQSQQLTEQHKQLEQLNSRLQAEANLISEKLRQVEKAQNTSNQALLIELQQTKQQLSDVQYDMNIQIERMVQKAALIGIHWQLI